MPNKVYKPYQSSYAQQLKKRHRIIIQVLDFWFPLVDINPQPFVNIYEADKKDFIKATHRIYHDAEHASKTSISILKN
jgi:predicted acyl esterase